jgi:hypothetical protein
VGNKKNNYPKSLTDIKSKNQVTRMIKGKQKEVIKDTPENPVFKRWQVLAGLKKEEV